MATSAKTNPRNPGGVASESPGSHSTERNLAPELTHRPNHKVSSLDHDLNLIDELHKALRHAGVEKLRNII